MHLFCLLIAGNAVSVVFQLLNDLPAILPKFLDVKITTSQFSISKLLLLHWDECDNIHFLSQRMWPLQSSNSPPCVQTPPVLYWTIQEVQGEA